MVKTDKDGCTITPPANACPDELECGTFTCISNSDPDGTGCVFDASANVGACDASCEKCAASGDEQGTCVASVRPTPPGPAARHVCTHHE